MSKKAMMRKVYLTGSRNFIDILLYHIKYECQARPKLTRGEHCKNCPYSIFVDPFEWCVASILIFAAARLDQFKDPDEVGDGL